MSVYNPSRHHENILAQFSQAPPSFTVHFHQEHWLINQSRPHLYHTPISFLLEDIRERRIPTDWLASLDQNNITFYDGCLLIDLHDHRLGSGDDSVVKERVILQPNAETLWADICLEHERNNAMTSDEETMEIEARILAATSPPLCLDPDPLITRIVNTSLRDSAISPPAAFKRKQDAVNSEKDDAAKAQEGKIMALMNPHVARQMTAPFRLFEYLQRKHPASTVNQFHPDPNHTQHPSAPLKPVTTFNHATPVSNAPTPISLSSATIDTARKTIKFRKKTESRDNSIALESTDPEPSHQAAHHTPQPTSQHLPSQSVPDYSLASQGKMKRKASTSAPAPPPTMKKKQSLQRASESVEPSPIHPNAPLPPTPNPVQMAYPLPPSTSIPFAKKPPTKKNSVPVQVKTEPTQPQNPNYTNAPMRGASNTPAPSQMDMMGHPGPPHQPHMLGHAAQNLNLKDPPQPPAIPPHASGQFIQKQEPQSLPFSTLGQPNNGIPHHYQPQLQSTPTSSPHLPPGGLPPAQQQAILQRQAQAQVMNRAASNQNRNQVQARQHMLTQGHNQSPFQQHASVASPQLQAQGQPIPIQQMRSPHPQPSQAPSRPPSTQLPPNHSTPSQNQMSYPQTHAMKSLQIQQQQQQHMHMQNTGFQLHLPGAHGMPGMQGVPAAGWRVGRPMPTQQQMQQQQQFLQAQQQMQMFPQMGVLGNMAQTGQQVMGMQGRGPIQGAGQVPPN